MTPGLERLFGAWQGVAAGLVTGAVPAAFVACGSSLRRGADLSSAQHMGLLIAFALVAGFAGLPLARVPARIAASVPAAMAAVAAAAVALSAGNRALVALAVLGGVAAATASAASRRSTGSGASLGPVFGWVLGAAATALVFSVGAGWRGAFAVSAVLCAMTAAAGALLPQGKGAQDPTDFSERRGRVTGTPTVRRLLMTQAALGALLVPGAHQLIRLLADSGYRPAAQAAVAALIGVGALSGGIAVRARFDAVSEPAAAVRVAVKALLVGAVLLLIAPALGLALLTPVLVAVAVAVGAASMAASAVAAAAVPAALRPVGSIYSSIWRWGYGTVGGLLLAAAIERRFGGEVALAVLGGVLLLAARATSRAVGSAPADVSRVAQGESRGAVATGRRAGSLLECRGIDFSYGPVQVLFDVDFTVDEGEMVALLGTNGAGKSTLLRVVSGLGIPAAGSVRLKGEDITFLDPDRRLRRGVAQIPGGKAVFGPMTVTENLRAYGFVHGRNRAAIDRGIDRSFDMFPRLHERRGQSAGTLSGGEQQMLALSKAFILEPQLLLIDELSLGLAPKVVGELLEMVRQINAQGTAVVLVEQSVNVALSLVDHAYFMEKGAVQFDGAAEDLMSRTDLLRSVFLEGAAKGLAR